MPNTRFCTSCGAPVSALPAQAVPTGPTKRRPWFAVITIVLIILAFLGGASITPERVVTVTTTQVSASTVTKTVTTGLTVVTPGVQRLKIGQTFVVLAKDKVPVEITFTRAWYTDRMGLTTADKGYKFVVLDVTVKNVGTKETSVFSMFSQWTVKVDKGYTYNQKSIWYLPLDARPEETKTGYVYFEILQDTIATEIRCIDTLYLNIDFTVEL